MYCTCDSSCHTQTYPPSVCTAHTSHCATPRLTHDSRYVLHTHLIVPHPDLPTTLGMYCTHTSSCHTQTYPPSVCTAHTSHCATPRLTRDSRYVLHTHLIVPHPDLPTTLGMYCTHTSSCHTQTYPPSVCTAHTSHCATPRLTHNSRYVLHRQLIVPHPDLPTLSMYCTHISLCHTQTYPRLSVCTAHTSHCATPRLTRDSQYVLHTHLIVPHPDLPTTLGMYCTHTSSCHTQTYPPSVCTAHTSHCATPRLTHNSRYVLHRQLIVPHPDLPTLSMYCTHISLCHTQTYPRLSVCTAHTSHCATPRLTHDSWYVLHTHLIVPHPDLPTTLGMYCTGNSLCHTQTYPRLSVCTAQATHCATPRLTHDSRYVLHRQLIVPHPDLPTTLGMYCTGNSLCHTQTYPRLLVCTAQATHCATPRLTHDSRYVLHRQLIVPHPDLPTTLGMYCTGNSLCHTQTYPRLSVCSAQATHCATPRLTHDSRYVVHRQLIVSHPDLPTTLGMYCTRNSSDPTFSTSTGTLEPLGAKIKTSHLNYRSCTVVLVSIFKFACLLLY